MSYIFEVHPIIQKCNNHLSADTSCKIKKNNSNIYNPWNWNVINKDKIWDILHLKNKLVSALWWTNYAIGSPFLYLSKQNKVPGRPLKVLANVTVAPWMSLGWHFCTVHFLLLSWHIGCYRCLISTDISAWSIYWSSSTGSLIVTPHYRLYDFSVDINVEQFKLFYFKGFYTSEEKKYFPRKKEKRQKNTTILYNRNAASSHFLYLLGCLTSTVGNHCSRLLKHSWLISYHAIMYSLRFRSWIDTHSLDLCPEASDCQRSRLQFCPGWDLCGQMSGGNFPIDPLSNPSSPLQ